MSAAAPRRAVVTGAAGGIGSAVVAALSAEGAHVVGWDSRPAPVGAAGEHLVVDLTDEESVRAATASTLDRLGGVDVLVTAAGLLRTGRTADLDLADLRAMIDVNVVGVFLAAKHLGPHLDHGCMVVLGSVSAKVGHDTTTGYGATKGAVLSMSLGLAQELATSGTRVVCVSPGWVDAGFTHQVLASGADRPLLEERARAAHLLGRMAAPQEVADVICMVASPRAAFMTGAEVVVDGGFLVKR